MTESSKQFATLYEDALRLLREVTWSLKAHYNDLPKDRYPGPTTEITEKIDAFIKQFEDASVPSERGTLTEPERLAKKWLSASPAVSIRVDSAGALLWDALHPTAASVPSARVCIGWIQELADGRKCFYEGDLDPREVHDNGKPCYRVFK